MKKKGAENEWRFRVKYGGLHLCNPDDGKVHVIEGDNLEFHPKKRENNPRGWKVLTLELGKVAKKDGDRECHNIDEELFYMIRRAVQPAELNICFEYGDDEDDGDGGVYGQIEEE